MLIIEKYYLYHRANNVINVVSEEEPVCPSCGAKMCFVSTYKRRLRDEEYKDWVKPDDDDYYYYKRILQPGETTSALFTGVKIPPLADKQFGKAESDSLKIDVYEESVQVEHAGVYFMNYDAAWDFYMTFR